MISFNEDDILKSVCRDSFYAFVQEFWSTIIAETPIWNWHIKYLCDELQVVAERVFENKPKEYDLIINIAPGSTKSTICSVMFPAWVWLRMKHARFITGSYAHDLSLDLSRKSRDLIESMEYQAITSVRLRRDQRVKSYYLNTDKGMRFAVGVGGKVTGFHAHFLIVDDPLNPKEAVSDQMRVTANTWMSDTLSSRKVDKMLTPTILIMQRLHQDDCTAHMLEKAVEGRVKHICIPAELTELVNPPELARYYEDGLMDPIRLGRDVLAENQAKGEYLYAGQYLQHPVPLGGGMFKTGKFRIEGVGPQRFKETVRFWDKAGTHEGGAFTVGAKLGLDMKGRYWVLDIKRGQWASHDREEIIKQTAEQDGRRVVVGIEQEPGSGGKESAENTVKMLAGWRVFVDRPTGDKALRADPYSCQVNMGNVSLISAEWNAAYIDELTYFPFSKFKDQTDASSGAFNRLARRRPIVGGLPRSKRNRALRKLGV